MQTKKYKINIIEIYILFLLLAYLLRTIGAYSLVPTRIDSLVFTFAGLVGEILFISQLLKVLKQRNFKYYNWLLIAFLTVLFLSTIVNYKFSPIGNIKVLAWQAIFLLMIYSTIFHDFNNQLFFDIFRNIIVIFGFFMSIVSLAMFAIRFSYSTGLENKQNPLRIGIVENRLFGSYTDPNYAAVMAVVIIILSLYYLLGYQKLKTGLRLFYTANIIIQIMYIGLSGSRNGLIVLTLVTFTFIFFKLFHSVKTKAYNIYIRVIISLILAMFCAAMSFVVVDQTKNLLAKTPAITAFDGSKFLKKENDKNINHDKSVSLVRKDVSDSSDVSNLRFTIWKSAVDIFKENPLLGVPPKSLHEYAEKKMPTTYLAKTKLAVHNAYINVLVSTGTIGAIIMLIFLLKAIVNSIISAFTRDIFSKNSHGYHLLAVLTLFLSGFFHNEMFLMATSSALIFWVFLASVQAKNELIKEDKN
ncbi:O-antigen ligase family protein [Enterococcus hermanniensis]|uniref:O-antigen ligase-related domain-containing protein n=1 Tax=Enterococcus hermanniensis TaxID=249189 RepID=A0A1L8TL86_9ENTE|nr:O-antigen ligase family protein [Enterococcus hermanniensis]OJG45056.1 hypothetical protein RV04_GL002370 [Enterococcus hermanniensis]